MPADLEERLTDFDHTLAEFDALQTGRLPVRSSNALLEGTRRQHGADPVDAGD